MKSGKVRSIARMIAVMLLAMVVTVTYSVSPLAGDAYAAAKKPTKMTLKATSKTVDIKGKVTVSVKSVTPSGASKAVTYKSSNKKIATVSKKGVVTGKKKGTVKITVTSKANKKLKKTIKIKVKQLKAKKLTLSKKTASLNEGSTLTLKAKASPAGVYAPVKWKSSNKKVATVSSKGKITAVAPGEATITAYTSKKTAGKALKATCKVTVTEDRTVFVDAAYVKEASKDKDTVIAEVSWGPDAPKELIPGAIHVNTDDLESNAQDDGYELWDLRDSQNGYKKLMDALASYGITTDTKLICYGWGETNSAPTRLAMAALMLGVKDVKVLEGGTKAWFDAGYDKAEASAPVPAKSFGRDTPLHPDWVVDSDQVVEKVESDPNFKLVSIRSYDEFIGKNSGYGYIDKAGEPKGAIWGRDTDDGTYFVDGKMIGIDKLNEYLADYGASTDNELAFYCGTGWRATIPFLICYEAGIDNMKLFDDGWYVYSGAFADEWNWVNGTKPSKEAKDYPVQIGDPKKGDVKYAKVSDLSADLTSINISAKQEEVEVHATGTNANYFTLRPGKPYAVKFESSDPEAASIDENGVVTVNDLSKVDGVKITATSNATYGSTPEKEGTPHTASYTLKAATPFADMTDEEWAKWGIPAEEVTPDDYLIDVRPEGQYDNGLVPADMQAPVAATETTADQVANAAKLDQALKEANGRRIVIVCVSGNKLAKNTMNYFESTGADMSNITYLIGGFNNAWSKSFPVVAKDMKSLSFNATVAEKFTKSPEAVSHLVLNDASSMEAPFRTAIKPLELYRALEFMGAKPWSTSDMTFEDGLTLSEAGGDNPDFTHLEITVDGAPLSDCLNYKKDGADADSAAAIDMAFSGNKINQAAWNTGCVSCIFSCYAGIVSNNAVGMGTADKDHNYFYVNTDKLSAGDEVQLVYTLK